MNIEGKPGLTIDCLDESDYELELDEYIKQWLKEKGIKL